MVTFQSENMESQDLKVPVFVKTSELIGMLSKTFGISVGRDSRLQAEPLGRILDNSLTLLEEGVGDGALLTLINR
ncbi:UNVERIFIED_CONTAM: hypothetical protein Cloal_2548 [Acetivibrio alkalicellulosi]